MDFIDKQYQLVRNEVNEPKAYFANAPVSTYFYVRAAIEQATGIRLELKVVKKLLDEEFGRRARVDTISSLNNKATTPLPRF